MKQYIMGFVALTSITALAFAATQGQEVAAAKINEESPNWTLPDSNGKSHNLNQYAGKFVVLEWTNKDCPFVVKHYDSGNMQATQKKAREMGAVWLSIISSAPGKQGYLSPDEANAHMKEKSFHCDALLHDPNGVVGRIYGARTTPQIVIIDPRGNMIYNGAIDDRPSSNPADIPGARNHALAALEEAKAGKPVSVPTSRPYGCSVKY